MISELRTIVSSIFNSLRSLMFTLLIIMFLIYVMSISLTQIVSEHAVTSDDQEAKDTLAEFFPSLPWSALVLFQTMTGGIDWGDVANPLTKYISPWMAIFL